LGGEPYRLLEAADGQQALDIADKELPDLILLDVLMPGMDGIATLRTLKGLDSWGVSGVSVGAVLLHRPAGVPSITVSHARMHLNCRIIGVIPPEQDLTVAAGETGQPLVLSHPESTAAVALTELATRLMADQVPALAFSGA
jgi:CheY-like chemotaxis protein